jgi:hypothetical protein
VITRRWVLNGLITAPAVIIAGRFMPPPIQQRLITLEFETNIEWLTAQMQDEMVRLLSATGQIPLHLLLGNVRRGQDNSFIRIDAEFNFAGKGIPIPLTGTRA